MNIQTLVRQDSPETITVVHSYRETFFDRLRNLFSDGNTAELSVVLSMNQPAIREISRLFSNYQISEIMKKPPVTIGTEGKKPRTRKPKAK
jgi:hypothetical protein